MSDHIQTRLDDINDKLHSIDKTLAVNTEQLAEHMKRSLANEKAVELLAQQMEPVKEHVSNIKFLIKSITWLAGVSGLAWAVFKAMHMAVSQ